MTGATVAATVLALFAVLSSRESAATLAPFELDPSADGVTTNDTLAEAPLWRRPRAHDTGAVPAQFPWLACTETNVVPGGGVSVRTTFRAGAGPELWTEIVKVRFRRSITGFGVAACVTDRSALGG